MVNFIVFVFVALLMHLYQPIQCQPRPECAPENPNRPSDCPICPPEGCRSSTMDTATGIPMENVTSASTDKTQFRGLTTEEISKFSASFSYGASVRVHTDYPRVFFITASGLPDHETQRVNPNTPTAQNYNITILKNPQIVPVPGCVGLGMIGITRTGVAIYNPLAGELTNAVEGSNPETFDECDGHASPNGAYHYHKIPDSCLYKGEIDEFIGVALDGFPIYGPRVGLSKNISEAELDKCHGKFVNGSYRYYVTEKFPYYLGCFTGLVVNQGTITSYNCTTDTSHWNMEKYGYDYYLCHCVNSGPGGGGGGRRPECAPDNPNRPLDCPECPPEGCRSTTMETATRPPMENVTTSNSKVHGLTSEEISKFTASSNYGASVRVHIDDPRVFHISASGLPDHETQRVNPNTPTAQNYNITILKNPQIVPVPGCVGLGMIGITRTGVAIYNPLAGELTNAVEGSNPETFDECDGHASPNGAYHYHKIPDSCLYKGEIDEFIGVALDGFPIYGPRVGLSKNISEAELDKCHGKFVNGSYRYYVTEKFPYYLGCFKGLVVNQGTITSYNCTTDTSHWNMEKYGYDYYLCHCVNSGPGGGGGGRRPECAPDNPNRPLDCPECPPEGCRSTTMETATRPPMENVTTSNSKVHGLTREEISKFTASSKHGASVRVHTDDPILFHISASGLPDHETQRVNPNTPTAQNYNITILKNPQVVPVPGCVGLGMIGITRTGVAIYNPLAGELTNAVEGSNPETFDECDGHASPNGAYHYHKIPDSCLYKGEIDEFIGVALDGFPIYGPRVGLSKNISEAELDKCHGKFVNGSYRYYVTKKFPYYLGCFTGLVVNQGTITSYNCTTNISHWNMENYGYEYYLCHCVNSGPGGGGGHRPECAPDNPNRPSDCPQCPPEGCRSTTIDTATRAPISTTKRVVLPNVVDGDNAAGPIVAEILPFLSLFSVILLSL